MGYDKVTGIGVPSKRPSRELRQTVAARLTTLTIICVASYSDAP